MEPSTNYPITVQAHINKPINIVWDFWVNPGHIVNWYFASADWHCPYVENHLVAGGLFNFRMEALDMNFGFNFQGVYNEVVEHKLISYSLGDLRKVIVKFKNMEDGVLITETFDPESANSIDLQKNGWQAILNNFREYVESSIHI